MEGKGKGIRGKQGGRLGIGKERKGEEEQDRRGKWRKHTTMQTLRIWLKYFVIGADRCRLCIGRRSVGHETVRRLSTVRHSERVHVRHVQGGSSDHCQRNEVSARHRSL